MSPKMSRFPGHAVPWLVRPNSTQRRPGPQPRQHEYPAADPRPTRPALSESRGLNPGKHRSRSTPRSARTSACRSSPPPPRSTVAPRSSTASTPPSPVPRGASCVRSSIGESWLTPQPGVGYLAGEPCPVRTPAGCGASGTGRGSGDVADIGLMARLLVACWHRDQYAIRCRTVMYDGRIFGR